MNARFLRPCAVLALAALSFAAPAQDIGSVLRGVLEGRSKNVDDVLNAIRSVTDVSFGQAAPGAGGPPDTQGKVVLYRTVWCGYCKQAAAHMKERNVDFIERDIEASPAAKAEFRGLGGKGVPLILMGDKTMSGFRAADFEQAYARFQQTASTAAGEAPAAARPPATSPAAATAPAATAPAAVALSGVLRPKIGNIKLYELPSPTSRIVGTLQKGDEVVASGEVQNGFVKVDGANVSGAWVRASLVAP